LQHVCTASWGLPNFTEGSLPRISRLKASRALSGHHLSQASLTACAMGYACHIISMPCATGGGMFFQATRTWTPSAGYLLSCEKAPQHFRSLGHLVWPEDKDCGIQGTMTSRAPCQMSNIRGRPWQQTIARMCLARLTGICQQSEELATNTVMCSEPDRSMSWQVPCRGGGILESLHQYCQNMVL
jgi:hypothetical protein